MPPVTSKFAMEIFDRRRARSERLAEFLALYVHHFGPEHRTATNELIEFLSSPVAGQVITYFGLTYDGKPCGFATLMFYPEGPIGIIDHLVIAPNVRGYGGFFNFCDLIAGYIEKQRPALDHIVAEVMLNDQSLATSIKPSIMVRMMRMVGFRVAKIAYWAPDPEILQDVENCRSALLFASQPERENLPSTEFVRLVHLIYETHYARWYERTMPKDQFQNYHKVARELLHRIEIAAAKDKRVVLNGMKNLDLAFSLDPSPSADPLTYFYIGLLAIPAVVGVAVAFAQERMVAAVAAGFSVFLIGLFAANQRLRHLLMVAFRLK